MARFRPHLNLVNPVNLVVSCKQVENSSEYNSQYYPGLFENIRDGIIDALYYRLAKSACEKHGDVAAAKVLDSIRTSAKSSIADYNAARRKMAELILKLFSRCAKTRYRQL